MEIGSEFWEVSSVAGRKKFLLSGRTALEYILRDILEGDKIESAILPSYCCHTMIEPFVRHGIPIRFYDVYYDQDKGLCAELKEKRDNEIFYYMTYFGFSDLSGIDLETVRNSYEIIIEDKTHSWLEDNENSLADYSYISYRKWAGFYGIAEASKKKGRFIPALGEIGTEYSSRRKEAMLLKNQYIDSEGISIDKEVFLKKFNAVEELLETDYVGYTPTEECQMQLLNADLDFIKKKRRSNADILLHGLRGIDGCTLVYKKMKSGDTPLFVPILVEEERDELRKYLIDHQIYCPVHWPLSDYHQGLPEYGKLIYQKELSLVCDQRYREEDMERTVSLIHKYYNEGI